MRYIFMSEIKSLILKNRKILLLIIFSFLCSVISINITIDNFMTAYEIHRDVKVSYGEKTIYKISLNGGSEVFSRVFGDSYREHLINAFYELKNHPDFQYEYTFNTPVWFELDHFEKGQLPKVKDECVYDYEQGLLSENKTEDLLYVKAVFVSDHWMETSGDTIKLQDGHMFEKSDFYVDSLDHAVFPIILGDEYRADYEIGDVIDYAHAETTEEVTLKVVGFFEKGSYFFDNNNERIILDRYMALPNVEMKQIGNMQDATIKMMLQDIYNTNKIMNARIICKDSEKNQIEKEVYRIFAENELYEFKLFDETGGAKRYLEFLRDQTRMNAAISCFVIILGIMLFCFQQYYYLRTNEKKFAIYTLQGMTGKEILQIIMIYPVVILLTVSLLYALFGYIVKGLTISYIDLCITWRTPIVVIMLDVILLSIMGFAGFLMSKKMIVCDVLRENE